MGGCRCSYKNCPSATKTTENIHFFHYPVKQAERCRKWIENACKPAFFDLAEDQLRNKVVCELHFDTKCFTNIEKKRLLHDAVPTLDVGCEDESSSDIYQIRNFEDVQILPANADGTIFTVDTDSMQQIVETQKVESYIYKDGMLMPLMKKQSSGRNEDVIYTMEDVKIKQKGNEIFFERVNSEQGHSSGDFMLNKVRGNGAQDDPYQYMHVKDETSNGSSSNASYYKPSSERTLLNPGPISKNVKQRNAQKKFVKQIKQHSREIASIKRVLKTQKPILYTRMNRMSALHALRGHVPSTLLTLVNLSVHKNDFKCCAPEDLEFFRCIFETSPEVFNLLSDKYGWNLPDPAEFQECKGE